MEVARAVVIYRRWPRVAEPAGAPVGCPLAFCRPPQPPRTAVGTPARPGPCT